MAQPDLPTDLRWQNTTEEEMRAFLAINILMEINQLPNAEMFWSSNPFINNAGITNTMKCNRFQKLVQYFHVADRSTEPGRGEPGYDKLFKVRPVMESVSRTFQDIYMLNKEVSIDEAMIAFTGRLSFRQYMPAKSIKRGIKMWMLCDARTAFLARFEVYLGRQNNQTEHGLGDNVVMRLVDHIYHSFRWLIFDNFFTVIPLMKELLEKGLYACGTVRVNRKGFPSQLKKPAEVRQRGDFKIMQMGDTNLTATVWKDMRLVHHLVTLRDPTVILPVQRRCGVNVLQLQSPHSVNVYNMYMGGVDLHDQYRAKNDVGSCSKNYWRYLFWFLLNCCIVNAFIMYKLTSRRRIGWKRFTHLDFGLELVPELAGVFCKRKGAAPEGRGRDGLVEQMNMGGWPCHVPTLRQDKGLQVPHLIPEAAEGDEVRVSYLRCPPVSGWLLRQISQSVMSNFTF
ncbi:piggyBac transposable element-derived protein 4-like [Dreissena polymorpha]|uniref:piggyBac transposable element-derived protein 4-like n=1 Tax=Dreissena polymorpha TaxID=45954 RepID=UPI002264B8E5|nr:piggyBac transposable element-derived protein 4-like [Dreissena polymorpha]